ncbi:MAG TPA: PQQ-binding-like beta-propeller repeat protein [Ktedonobacteraceae bacterium]
MHVAANSGATPRSLYFGGDRGNLYAVNAQTGSLRWCIHLNNPGPQITPQPCPGHCPPSFQSYFTVGTPAIVDGVVYVCASSDGETGDTYALNASDGSLRWRTQSGCWSVSMPFGDNAIPLVDNGIVYSGLAALRAQDGQVLWKETHIDFAQDGELILLAVTDGVLYACTEAAVYALNAADGSLLWRYPPHAYMTPGGPLIVSRSNHTLIVGTQGSVDQPETSALYAISTDNGTLRWYRLMGDYAGAVFMNNQVYVSSRDQYLYALNVSNGKTLWRHKFIYPTYNPALAVNGTLYINIDGAYALNSADGSVLWHQLLGSSQSNAFSPSFVADGIDYLASTDGQGNSTLYALNSKLRRRVLV